ncbi:MAG: HIRAN domain-containing protein [Sulfobacillus sp.]
MAQETTIAYWPETGIFPVKVVGARYYRDAIKRVAQNAAGSSALVFCTASLAPEPNNPHDAQAVAVMIAGEKVGHLQRDIAPALRSRLRDAGLDGEESQCRAVVSAGLEASDRIYDYIIELDFDLSSEPRAPIGTLQGIERRNSDFPLECQSDDTYLVHVWLGEGVLGYMHKHKKIHSWTTDDWDSVNYYVLNSRGIGLGHKLFSVPKDVHQRYFGSSTPTVEFKSINGRNATIEVRTGA